MRTDILFASVVAGFVGRFIRNYAIAPILVVLLCSSLVRGQTPASGTLTGRVSNAATQKYLAGVEVVDKATSKSVYTDTDGSFIFFLPAGERTIVVRYSSLDSQEIVATIVGGQTVVRDFALTSSDYEKDEVLRLSAFIVSGEREGRAASIAQQKASDSMVNVLSSDEFPNVAGANLGDFLRNIPGIDIMDNGSDPRDIRIRGMDSQSASVTSDGLRMANAAGTDGNTRAFNLDQTSIQNYETIEVYKTPTASMAADSGGGSINLVSKSAFNLKSSRMKFQAGGMMNSEYMSLRAKAGSGGKDYTVRPSGTFEYANSFLKHRLGVMFTVNYNDLFTPNTSATDTKRTIYDQDSSAGLYHPGKGEDFGVYSRSMNYSYGTGITRRTAVSLNLDYKLTESIKLYANSQVNTSLIKGGSQQLSVGSVDINSSATLGGTVTGLIPDHWITNEQGLQVPVYSPYTATIVTGSNEVRANTVQDAANSRSSAYASTGLEILNKIGHGTTFALGAEYKKGGWKINVDGGVSQSTNHYTTENGLDISSATAYLRGIDYRIDHPAGSDYPILTQLNGPDIYDLSNYVSDVYVKDGRFAAVSGTNRNVPTGMGNLYIPGVSTDKTFPIVQRERGDYAPFEVSNGRWLATKDKFTTGKFDAKRSFATRFPMYLQAGGLYREQERHTDKNGQSRWFFNGTTAELQQVLQSVESPDLNDAFGPYKPVPYFSLPYIDQYFREHREKFSEDVVWRTETEREGDKYSRERVTGGYGMFNIKLWRLSMLLGARYERTDQYGRAAIIDNDAPAIRASEMLMDYVRGYGYADITSAYNDTSINSVTGQTGRVLATGYIVNQEQALELTRLRYGSIGIIDKTYADWFPNVQLKYNFTTNLVLRTSFNKSISRQPFDRLAPGYTVSSNTEGGYTVTMNNPSLKPVYYNNYDIAVEYYTPLGGSCSLGYFYKDVENYTAKLIESITTDTVTDYDLSAYVGGSLEHPTNVGGAKHWGVEASVSQRLGILGHWLKPFQIYAAYTYMDAQSSSNFNNNNPTTGLTGRPTYMPVTGAIPKKYKINLNYQYRRMNASVAYNWASTYAVSGPYRIGGASTQDDFTYIYREARGTIDVAASVKLYKNYSFYAEAKNLTNAPVRQYMDNKKWMQNYNRYGAFVYFGIKGEF